MKSIWTLAFKDLLLVWRDKMGLFWVIVFPFLMALFFGSIFGSSRPSARALKIALVKNDSPAAQSFYTELEKSSVLSVKPTTLDSAKTLVTRGDLVAYVNYKDTPSSETDFLEYSQNSIEVGIDPSRKAEAGYLQGIVSQTYYSLLQKNFSDPSFWQKSLQSQTGKGVQNKEMQDFFRNLEKLFGSSGPAKISPLEKPKINFSDVTLKINRPRSAFEITFPQSLQWAMIACAATFALSIVIERTQGTYLRLRVAPLTSAHILAGKGLACFIACVLVSTFLMGIGILVFKVQIVWPLGLALSILAASLCFVGVMMLVSVLGKTERAVSGSSWGILMIFAMLGGAMVPLVVMPSWMMQVGSVSPIKWSVLALEGVIWRGFTLENLLMPLGMLLGIGAVSFLIGVSVLLRSESL